jgi:16S rRNA (cytosine1402-N4)-methyltransferase
VSEAFAHRPVLLDEVLQVLRPESGRCYADGTLGAGGHAAAVLAASAPAGFLYGCDRDGLAVAAALERLAAAAPGRFELRRGTYETMDEWVASASCAGVLLDLGVSSPQLDQAVRGFSFRNDGPLDMRMDDRQVVTAETVVNTSDEEALVEWFFSLGEERHARRIARAMVAERRYAPFRSTLQLATLIERICPRHGQRLHPATRVFQALRMVVNDEMGQLERGLPRLWRLVAPGGRLAVITFHSVEDRVVKGFGRELVRDYFCPGPVDVPELRQPVEPRAVWVSRKPLRAGEAEVASNPRARSAQLRVLEKR